MRVAVTGGTGFIGPKVIHELRAVGHDVRVLVRSEAKARTLRAWGCEITVGSLDDPEAVRRTVFGREAVVHLVSIIAGRPADFERVMTRGTQRLVDAAAAAGVGRFVLVSALGTDERTRELVPYYRAKWEMEQAVLGSGLAHVILRPGFVFGSDGGVLPLFVRQVRWAPVTPIVGDGTQRIQPIWVSDLAAFALGSVERPDVANRTFELGGPDVVDWNGLYARIRKVLALERKTVHVPVGLARTAAAFAELLPHPPVTRDQISMITSAGDNVCDMTPALETFRLPLVGLDEQIRRAG